MSRRTLMYGVMAVVGIGVFLLIAARFLGGPDVAIMLDNRTSVDVCMDINGDGYHEVKAYDRRTVGYRMKDEDYDKITVTYRTKQGALVHRETMTLEELAARGNRVILVAYATLTASGPGPIECKPA